MQQLKQMNLSGFASALQRQFELPAHYLELSFDERLSVLLVHELTTPSQREIQRLEKQARFRLAPQPEQIDFRVARGIDKCVVDKS